MSRAALVFSYAVFVGASIYGSVRTKDAADDARGAVAEVQEQRAAAIRLLCEQTNARNVGTKAYLDSLPPFSSRAAVDALVDALVPVQDCDAAVVAGTNGGR